MSMEREIVPTACGGNRYFNRYDLYSFMRVITNNFRPPAPYNSRVSCAALLPTCISKINLSLCLFAYAERTYAIWA